MDSVFKAMRTYRTLPSLMVMLVSAAFADMINKEIIILGLCCVLVYSAAGIHNAIKDNDYPLPQYAKKVIFALLFAAIIISLSNKIIFFAVMAGLILGLIYNTISRFILLGDSTILAITHFALPSLSASLILGLDLRKTILLSGFFFLIAWFITQTKNLKDTRKDRNRNYATLTTRFHNGALITNVLLFISFIFMLVSHFLFKLTARFVLTLIIISLLIIIALKKINSDYEAQGLNILRLVILTFMLGLIIEKTPNYFIVLSGIFLWFLYLLYLLMPQINKVMGKHRWLSVQKE